MLRWALFVALRKHQKSLITTNTGHGNGSAPPPRAHSHAAQLSLPLRNKPALLRAETVPFLQETKVLESWGHVRTACSYPWSQHGIALCDHGRRHELSAVSESSRVNEASGIPRAFVLRDASLLRRSLSPLAVTLSCMELWVDPSYNARPSCIIPRSKQQKSFAGCPREASPIAVLETAHKPHVHPAIVHSACLTADEG